MNKNMTCIDFYSGIGGWTLGMKLSGIQNINSYEWYDQSNKTHNENFNTSLKEIDIRKLSLTDLPSPKSIDFVVGSPPCTQFSYSNRGGSGDINDGLVDIYKFFTIVEYLKPKYWVMENVPRVKGIINNLVDNHEEFKRFKKLMNFNDIVDSSEYGLPQKRLRMICGNFPYELFLKYKTSCKQMNMKEVIDSLNKDVIIDPTYGYKISKKEITDHIKEKFLSPEERRINEESKNYHPIYNKMNFPDLLTRPSRTITSTCTRVSRESIIIQEREKFRRLTIREKGMLQGFPVNYEFYGTSYSTKQKMIGNSIPPVLTYYIFQSMLKTSPDIICNLKENNLYKHKKPDLESKFTVPDNQKGRYPLTRSFRFSIPGLRFGSGVRFELSNSKNGNQMLWSIKFFYGNSKNIKSIDLSSKKIQRIVQKNTPELEKNLKELNKVISTLSCEKLQKKWINQSDVEYHPFDFLDLLGKTNIQIHKIIKNDELNEKEFINLFNGDFNKKLNSHKDYIYSGIILGSIVNNKLRI